MSTKHVQQPGQHLECVLASQTRYPPVLDEMLEEACIAILRSAGLLPVEPVELGVMAVCVVVATLQDQTRFSAEDAQVSPVELEQACAGSIQCYEASLLGSCVMNSANT